MDYILNKFNKTKVNINIVKVNININIIKIMVNIIKVNIYNYSKVKSKVR